MGGAATRLEAAYAMRHGQGNCATVTSAHMNAVGMARATPLLAIAPAMCPGVDSSARRSVLTTVTTTAHVTPRPAGVCAMPPGAGYTVMRICALMSAVGKARVTALLEIAAAMPRGVGCTALRTCALMSAVGMAHATVPPGSASVMCRGVARPALTMFVLTNAVHMGYVTLLQEGVHAMLRGGESTVWRTCALMIAAHMALAMVRLDAAAAGLASKAPLASSHRSLWPSWRTPFPGSALHRSGLVMSVRGNIMAMSPVAWESYPTRTGTCR